MRLRIVTPGLRRGVREQDRLEVDLVDAVRRLRRRPPGVGAARCRCSGRARRDVDARQLGAGDRGAEDDVVRIVGRQAGVAHRLRDAEPAEQLHGARRDVVALHVRRLAARPRLEHHDARAAPGEVHRQRQADRPGADDRDVGVEVVQGSVVVSSRSQRRQSSLVPERLMTSAHFGVSLAMKRPNSAEVVGLSSTPAARALAITSASVSAARISFWSRATIGGGVAGGRDDAEPAGRVVALDAGFGQRRHVGQLRQARALPVTARRAPCRP